MKVLKIFFVLSLVSVITILFQGSINDNNSGEDLSKSVRVTVRIGKGGCSGGFGVCRIIIRNKSEGNNIETLGANEFIGTVKWNKSTFDVTTSSEYMHMGTYSEFFSGSTFAMEEDYTIEKNAIENKKPITLKAGTYNIENVNGQKQMSLNFEEIN